MEPSFVVVTFRLCLPSTSYSSFSSTIENWQGGIIEIVACGTGPITDSRVGRKKKEGKVA